MSIDMNPNNLDLSEFEQVSDTTNYKFDKLFDIIKINNTQQEIENKG